MSRLFVSLALIAAASPQAQCAPPKCTTAACAWAWASATTEADSRSAAALAWASVPTPKDEPKPDPLPVTPVKPKPVPTANVKQLSGGWVSIRGWHFPQANECSEPGCHWHSCPCGRVCQHDDDNRGNIAAHTCVCGRVNLDKAEAGPVVRRPAAVAD